MKSYSRSQVSGPTLLCDLSAHLSQERSGMAEALADIGEIDARGLYRAAGYPSMHAFCVGKCHLTEQAAYKRINAARTAREFPVIFEALADGRLHLTAVLVLAPHLAQDNAEELVEAAKHKTKFEMECLIAQKFPKPDVPTRITPLATPLELSPGRVEEVAEQLSPGRVDVPPRPKVTPLAAERFALTLTMSQDMYDKLAHAKDLLSHQLPSGDIVQVLDRALDALIEKLEKRKFAATDKPRKSARESKNPRHISARVRRAVRERNGGRCTFIAENGHRCEARRFLEFDHVLEVARGGKSTFGNVRLRCRAHNQYTAEQSFSTDLMRTKREDAQRAAAKARAEEVVPYLQALGIRGDKARHASERCLGMPDASLEDRVKAALRCFGAVPSRPEVRQPIMSP